MSKKNLYRIIFCISLTVFIFCIFMFVKILLPQEDYSGEYYNTTAQSISESNTASSSEKETELPDNPINFKKLKKRNSDVYAWIKIPDTNVDYAVVQPKEGVDDNFYLNHNLDKKYEFAGTIYSQRKNSKDFSDFCTVLYGHDMLNRTMFATLDQFEKEDFFKSHDKIYIYTPGHILTYTVVSAYVYDDRHILNTFDFTKKEDRKEYIDSILDPKSMVRNVRDGIKLNKKSRILTLSTCTSVSSQRYLVQGVLKHDQ